MVRFIKIYLMLLFFLLCVPLTATAETGLRAIFDEGIYWAGSGTGSETKVINVLNRVQSAGFNTYIPVVWGGQGAIWPSKTVDLWFLNEPLAKKDPLKKFITLAHKKNIKVMPCIMLMKRKHSFYEQFTTKARKNMFNVHDIEFRKFITNVVIEVVQNYDIDGINLDYVRAGQVCYEGFCRKLYKEFSGHDLMADLAIHKVNQSAKDRIVAWQRHAVRSLIQDISREVRKIKPEVQITVCAAPWADTVQIEGQDSIAWAEEGLIDKIFSMNYQKEIPWDRLSLERKKLSNPDSLVIMIANYNKLQEKMEDGKPKIRSKTATELQAAVKRAMEFNGSGNYAVYLYSMLTDMQINGLKSILKQ